MRFMDILHIKSLIDIMARSDLAEMEVGKDGWTLRLVHRAEGAASRADPGPAQPAAGRPTVERGLGTPPSTPTGLVISAPLAGTVYFAPSPGEPAFVEIGQIVQVGATLCVIEAMKVFNEVKADRDGTVEAMLA